MLRKLSLCLAVVLSVSGCQNATTPLDNMVSTSNIAKKTKNIINGKVEFPSKFNTKAEISDIITNSTVSLIYPENYQDVTSRSKSVASGLSDINGNFSLNADYSFDPIIGQIFILEATKRVNSTGGDAISLRTYVQWNGTYFKSITKNSIHVNMITTAVAVMASFNTILPENTIDKLDITNGQTQISNIAGSNITSPMITYVKDLVELSLSKNQDPIGSIYYQQQKFLIKDISQYLRHFLKL